MSASPSDPIPSSPEPIPRLRALSGRTKILLGLLVLALLPVAVVALSERAEFVVGGALINVGYRLQDPLEDFDFEHGHDLRPSHIWDGALLQNRLASSVRSRFPRSSRHPLVAVVVCMDARIDTTELMGDTRKYYYMIRTAGSVVGDREEEMLELAVDNGVRLVLFTTHTGCAAERVAATPASRARYPALAAAVDERERRIAEFLARPAIAAKVASGELIVRRAQIDTLTGALLPREEPMRVAGSHSIAGDRDPAHHHL